jgi:ABC-2 type transport system permease protein
LRAIFRKELADYFTSIRIFILVILTLGISVLAVYQASQGINSSIDTEFVFLKLFTSQLPGESQTSWLITYPNILAMFFIPIMGIALGFDAINRERSNGTLSRLIAQPVYRDNIINAKFLSGIFLLSMVVGTSILLIAGYGLRMIGVPPSAEEIIRLFLFWVFTVVYGAFWMGLAMLFSTLFRNMASSLLSSLGIWLVFGVFLMFIGYFGSLSVNQTLTLSRISPSFLYSEALGLLLYPYSRGMGMLLDMLSGSDALNYLLYTPLRLGQSLTVAWPQFITIIALTVICFAVSYILFMRQEVRST